jgi:hypothetical protein
VDQINPSHNRFVFLCLIKTCSVRLVIDDDGDYVMKTRSSSIPRRDSQSCAPFKLACHGRRWHGVAQLANSYRRR